MSCHLAFKIDVESLYYDLGPIIIYFYFSKKDIIFLGLCHNIAPYSLILRSVLMIWTSNVAQGGWYVVCHAHSRVVLSVLAKVAWGGHNKFAADNFYLLSGQSYSYMSS